MIGSKLVAFLLFASAMPVAQAGEVPKHGFTPTQIQEMVEYNSKVLVAEKLRRLVPMINVPAVTSVRTPYAEYERAGFIIFSEDGAFNSGNNKLEIARNVPEDVTVVVFTSSSDRSYQTRLFNKYAKVIPAERLKIIRLASTDNGFWARDGIPVPTWVTDSSGLKKFSVVDAKYYYPFEPDKRVSEMFKAELVKIPYYHEGGNFMTNANGNCVVVDNVRAELIPDEDFAEKYGCKTVLRFPHLKGIGHIDEAVKFIDEDTVLTDTPQYVQGLKDAGFEVIMLPQPENHYETYANAILVNGVAFVPTFDQPTDYEAVRIYESMGYKVVALPSIELSNDGLGSLHCITMTYPPVEFTELLKRTGGKEVVIR